MAISSFTGIAIMRLVSTVMAMHETVHQGAGQQKQVGQDTKQMRAVFS